MASTRMGSPTDRARLEVANSLRNGTALTPDEVHTIAKEQGLLGSSVLGFSASIRYKSFTRLTGTRVARAFGERSSRYYLDATLSRDDEEFAIGEARKRERK